MGFKRKLKLGTDDAGYVTNEIPWTSAEQMPRITLEGGAEQTLAVPAWAYRMRFVVSPGATVWCGHGSTPITLATANWTYQLSEMNPMVRPAFDAGGNRITTLRFIAELAVGIDAWVQVIFHSENNADVPR